MVKNILLRLKFLTLIIPYAVEMLTVRFIIRTTSKYWYFFFFNHLIKYLLALLNSLEYANIANCY